MLQLIKGGIYLIIKNVKYAFNDINNKIPSDKNADILIKNGIITCIQETDSEIYLNTEVLDGEGFYILPSFIDLHSHLREPGFTHKETILTGSYAALNGGFSAVLPMANTKPVIDTPELVEWLLEQNSFITLLPAAAVTVGQQGRELTDFKALKAAGAVAVSDDGFPVDNFEIMEEAMKQAEKNKLLLVSHCEVRSIIEDRLNIPDETEYLMVKRDCELAKKLNTRVHIAHVSTKESVNIIRKAKSEGVRVSCETCPHYFSLTKDDFNKIGTNALMNPPLRYEEDVLAIIEGLKDGTIDIISTDHAPHSKEEKALPPQKAPFGIIGFETAFSVAYTYLVKAGHISLESLIDIMSKKPASIIGIPENSLKVGCNANFVLADLENEFEYKAEESLSKSKNTPYDKKKLYGKIKYNIINGVVNKCQQIY